MKLLIESTVDSEIITESVAGKKSLYIAGPFLMFGKPNANKRVYPQAVMESAVQEYRKDYIDRNRALGEFNHPADGRIKVDPERACIMTTSLEKDGPNHFFGKAKVLSTPLGNMLKALLDDDVTVGVSSRGAGSICKKGALTEVKNDYRLSAAADVVFNPSVTDAFVTHLMEDADYILVNGDYVQTNLQESRDSILKAPSHKLQQAKLNAFINFVTKIKA